MTQSPQIDANIWGMLFKVFAYPPVVHYQHYALFNTIYLAGPAFAQLNPSSRLLTQHLASGRATAEPPLPDDDWPYLNLGGRSISGFYWVVMAWIVGLAGFAILAARRSCGKTFGIDAAPICPCFCSASRFYCSKRGP